MDIFVAVQLQKKHRFSTTIWVFLLQCEPPQKHSRPIIMYRFCECFSRGAYSDKNTRRSIRLVKSGEQHLMNK